jgi:hypothetical protein
MHRTAIAPQDEQSCFGIQFIDVAPGPDTLARQDVLHDRQLWVCAMSEGRLLVEKRGAVGWLVFDNPAKRNALNAAMWRGIPEALAGFGADSDVRCVVLRGSGTKAFTAGAELARGDDQPGLRLAERLCDLKPQPV